MHNTRRIKIFALALLVLSVANVVFFSFALGAHQDKMKVHDQRYELYSALYQLNMDTLAIARYARGYALAGDERQYYGFRREMQVDRTARVIDLFKYWGASQEELDILDYIHAQNDIIDAIHLEVFRLRGEGHFGEAIWFAHTYEMPDLQDLRNVIEYRIDDLVADAQVRFTIFVSKIIAFAAIIVLIAFLGFFSGIKNGLSRSVVSFAALFSALALLTIFFVSSGIRIDREMSLTHSMKCTLTSAVHNSGIAAENLSNMARAFAITGDMEQYYSYLKEMGYDRFGFALDTFVLVQAPSDEINILVDLVSRVMALRSIEAEVLQLTLDGYQNEALLRALSPQYIEIGLPTHALSAQLLGMIQTRMSYDLAAGEHEHTMFAAWTFATMILFGMTGIAGLMFKIKDAKSGLAEAREKSALRKRLEATKLTTRLLASFISIIVVFITHIAISTYFNAQIDDLNYHSTNLISPRVETLWEYHQEFTDMRRILRQSFLNLEWRLTTSDAVWLSYEQELTRSYSRLRYLAEAYKESVRNDWLFPEMENDSRLHIMSEIMAYVSSMYDIYSINFFLSGNLTFFADDVINYAAAAEIKLQMLHRFINVNQGIIAENIEYYRILSNAITITTMVAAIILAIILAYSTTKNFTNRIKSIEKDASLVQQGDFAAAMQNEATDEISKIFRSMVAVFTRLISDIDKVATENAAGCNEIRIDQERFPGDYQKVVMVINSLLDNVNNSIKAIRAGEERMHLMLDGNPIACYLIDKNYKFLDCNNAAIELFDFANKEEALAGGHDNFMFDSMSMLQYHFKTAMEAGYTNFEWDLQKYNNTTVPCQISLVRFELDGKDVIAAYIQDMTAIHEMIAQIEKTAIAEENSFAKSKFLARMSHEIRTPITAVLGISEIQLQKPDLTLELEEAFGTIYSSGNTLLSIVNDILDLSKIEAGKMELYNEEYEIASLLSDLAQFNIAFLGSKPLEFAIDVDEDMPAYLIGDELRLKQALNNLLSNAFKYTMRGSVSLTVRKRPSDLPEHINVVVTIKDTGRGMTEQQLAALFDEYARFHTKDVRFEQGTGLGMPITHNLLQMMGATIDVASTVDAGTTVTLVIPQRVGENEDVLGAQTAQNLKNFNSSARSVSKRFTFTPESMPYGRVLIVDDVDANVYVARGLMGLYSLKIDSCSSGQEAIDRIKKGEIYDVIFMDQMMPEMTGMEATTIIRDMGYTNPIVALTANALVGQSEEFLKNGFDGFLSKPIQTIHLNAVLIKFIREKYGGTSIPALDADTDMNEYFEDFLKNSGMHEKTCRDFAANHSGIVANIMDAIHLDDLKTAHRLAHTLKGLAGLIQEKELMNLAERVEDDLAEGNVKRNILTALEAETKRVLSKIIATYPEENEADKPDIVLDKQKAKEVFEQLEDLLKQNSFDAMNLVDDLKQIPETKDLIRQIENIDFTLALTTLLGLRQTLEV